MPTQFKRDDLQACLLTLIEQGEVTLYALAMTLVQAAGAEEGASYPVLRGMLDDDWISSYLVEMDEGPPRKFYRMEVRGREALARLRTSSADVLSQMQQGMQGSGQPMAVLRGSMGCDAFLGLLRNGLQDLPPPALNEIVADYAAHFRDAADEGRPAEVVAAALGDPRGLVAQLRIKAPGRGRTSTAARPAGGYMAADGGAVVAIAGAGMVAGLGLGMLLLTIFRIAAAVTTVLGALVLIFQIPSLGLSPLLTVDVGGYPISGTDSLIGLGLLLLFSGLLARAILRRFARRVRQSMREQSRRLVSGLRGQVA